MISYKFNLYPHTSPPPPPSPLQRMGGGTECSTLLITVVFLVTNPHTEVIQEPTKSLLIGIKDTPVTQEIIGIEELCVRNQRQNPKMC